MFYVTLKIKCLYKIVVLLQQFEKPTHCFLPLFPEGQRDIVLHMKQYNYFLLYLSTSHIFPPFITKLGMCDDSSKQSDATIQIHNSSSSSYNANRLFWKMRLHLKSLQTVAVLFHSLEIKRKS